MSRRSLSPDEYSIAKSSNRRRNVTPDRRVRPSNGYSRESEKSSRKYSRSQSRSRSRSRVRSITRSPRRYRNKYSVSRSRSRSNVRRWKSNERDRDQRIYSRSPSPSTKKKEAPPQSRCLGVFGLSVITTEQKIHKIFSAFGPLERVQIVLDAKTGRSRGFCFVYFQNLDDAKVAKDQCSGMEMDGRRIRVDFSITQRAHTPTPGVYMGKPTRYYKEKGQNHDRYRHDDRMRNRNRYSRSPSYRNQRRRYDRSKSRSYSPRRK